MPHCGREGVLCWTVSHLSCQVLAFQESKRYQMCLLVNKCLYIFLFLQKLLYCNVMNKQLGTLNNVFFFEIANWQLCLVRRLCQQYLLVTSVVWSQQLQCISKGRCCWLCCHIARNLPYAYIVQTYYGEGLVCIHSLNYNWHKFCYIFHGLVNFSLIRFNQAVAAV